MLFRKKSEYALKSKKELKERLQILDYEVASVKDKKKLRSFYKEIKEIKKELVRIREEEKIVGRGR